LLSAAEDEPAFAESFRNLRSSLLFMSGLATQPKVVLVTSSVPKEGKSTVAANLALSLAMAGSRVLIIDADFRRGSLHRTFGTPMKPGLYEVLNQEVAPEDAIMATGQFDLHVMATGSGEKASSDIFLRRHIDRLLKDLSGVFDHIIIDSAPVLATDDAACIGPHTDGAFMVVRASYTSSRMAEEAMSRLRRRQVKLLGTVYNCAPRSSDYYCYYTHDYQHGGEKPARKSKPARHTPAGAEQRPVGEA
jgi:capsular exopolysaccharide synthesis family protein